ncbi:MAG: hypothetical protein M1343_14175 [Chloroflexi bacterium]|nr:hypothetical protein [Chloroflexota bacterium]MDA8188601.1 hypothetical protein [Dehalococcoidales bacterium]
MKRGFIVERQGKSFVLYAGLLDEAHTQGLKAIRTSLLQIPNGDNGQVAICHATVETEKGTFTGIGDASPANVAHAMLNCIIRMAETRAKARALRDAVNVGVAALEEMGENEESDDGPSAEGPRGTLVMDEQPQMLRLAPAAVGNGAHIGAHVPGLATPAQVRAIYSISRDQHGLTDAQVEGRSIELYGCLPAELTRKQASDFITALKGNSR